jgi:hypothetical protein
MGHDGQSALRHALDYDVACLRLRRRFMARLIERPEDFSRYQGFSHSTTLPRSPDRRRRVRPTKRESRRRASLEPTTSSPKQRFGRDRFEPIVSAVIDRRDGPPFGHELLAARQIFAESGDEPSAGAYDLAGSVAEHRWLVVRRRSPFVSPRDQRSRRGWLRLRCPSRRTPVDVGDTAGPGCRVFR